MTETFKYRSEKNGGYIDDIMFIFSSMQSCDYYAEVNMACPIIMLVVIYNYMQLVWLKIINWT